MALPQMSRTSWMVFPDPDNEDQRLILPAKGNPLARGRRFGWVFGFAEPEPGRSRVDYRAVMHRTAQTHIDAHEKRDDRSGRGGSSGRGGRGRPDADKTTFIEWLKGRLRGGTPVESETLKTEIEAAGFNPRWIYEVYDKGNGLPGLRSKRPGGGSGPYIWTYVPPIGTEDNPTPHGPDGSFP